MTRELLDRVPGRYGDHAVVSFLDADGYPVSVATGYEIAGGRVLLDRWADGPVPAAGIEVGVTFSHIRPQAGIGYDQRRYVELWGHLEPDGNRLTLDPADGFGWDEQQTPFFQYSEQTVPQAHRYLAELSARVGRAVRPRLSFGWLALRATRLPFLTATVVPVALGVAVAALAGGVRWGLAALTLLGAVCIHLGLNVANDVFDARSGADDANTTPTPFSGGSRVIQYGLVSQRTMTALAVAFYATGIGLGFLLAALTDFWPLVGLGAAGVAVSLAYTAPPLRLVHRGVGEVAVALGFGPITTLGAFFVQRETFALAPLWASLPVAVLIALVLYVNEIPDRTGDAMVGKRTLPVRLSAEVVVRGYAVALGAAYLLVVAGVVASVLPVPALLALATIPTGRRVLRGLRAHYDSPYELMAPMAENIKLHAVTGVLLLVGYGIAIAADRLGGPGWLS